MTDKQRKEIEDYLKNSKQKRIENTLSAVALAVGAKVWWSLDKEVKECYREGLEYGVLNASSIIEDINKYHTSRA